MADYTLSAKITGDASGFDKAIQNAEKSVNNFQAKIDSASSKIKSVGNSFSSFGAKMTVGVTTPLTIAGKNAISTAAEFESSMSRTQGALNATSAEMEDLKNLAIEMGAETIFSASDAGNAMNELAKGGLTAADIKAGALQSTMDLAASSGMDMATSANTVVKAMGGFQLSADETGQAVNALAGAASASAADVSDISEALSQCAASANNAGWSIQDTTAVLGAFADAGIVGSDAGTSLKTMLQSLSAPTAQAQSLMDELGINIYDSSGHMLDAAGVAEELQTALSGLGDQQRAQALDTIFGSDATRAATVLMNQGAEGLARYTQATNDQAAAQRLANAQMGPMQQSIEEMKGSIETASIAIGEVAAPYVQKFATIIGDLANKFSEASPQIQKFVLIAATIAAVAGPILTVIGSLISSVGTITGAFGSLSASIAKVGGMKAALSGVFTAVTGPIGIAVAAITALVAAFAYLMATNEQFRTSILSAFSSIQASIMPIMQQIASLLTEVGGILMSTITSVLQALAPVLATIVTTVAQLFAALAPLISQLVSSLAPVITQIVSVVSNLILSMLPPLIAIINSIMSVIQALIPPITSVLSTVVSVVSSVLSALSPIIDFVSDMISEIMSIISPIVSFVAGIISAIASVVGGLLSVVAGIFNSILSVVSSIMSNVGSVISGVLTGIQSAWNGLTGFVLGVFSGISGAVSSLVESVKGFVNGVISGINSAISIINKIPGVSIGTIPQLAGGTTNWQGGFAYMNEGGRGELTYLPNGSQVIPHDISVKYAKEAARSNTAAASLDLVALGDYIIAAMTEVGARQGEGLEKGISKMGLYVDGRQAGRIISDMGFVRG